MCSIRSVETQGSLRGSLGFLLLLLFFGVLGVLPVCLLSFYHFFGGNYPLL